MFIQVIFFGFGWLFFMRQLFKNYEVSIFKYFAWLIFSNINPMERYAKTSTHGHLVNIFSYETPTMNTHGMQMRAHLHTHTAEVHTQHMCTTCTNKQI